MNLKELRVTSFTTTFVKKQKDTIRGGRSNECGVTTGSANPTPSVDPNPRFSGKICTSRC